MHQEGKNGPIEPNSPVADADIETASEGKRASKEGGRDRRIKVEDDEDDEYQPSSPITDKDIQAGNSPAMGMSQRKRKATEDIGTMGGKGKRLTRSKSGNQPAGQQTSHVQPKVCQLSFSEPPPGANKNLTAAAHYYRDGGGVFIRPKVGWQFREIKGITKVWFDGKWRPLIQDQPNFKGVCEKGGWIVPIMARSKDASLEQRRRWERQGRVEFNSPF